MEDISSNVSEFEVHSAGDFDKINDLLCLRSHLKIRNSSCYADVGVGKLNEHGVFEVL